MDVAIWGALIGLAGVIAAVLIPRILDRRHKQLRRRVFVSRISSFGDANIYRALRIYERRIPSSERDEMEEIVRWIREVENETNLGICKLEDYFLAAYVGDAVAGFAYAQYYVEWSMAFFSYLVVDDTISEARECRVTTELLANLRKRLRDCRTVVMEVDDPANLTGELAKKARARIRHFKALARMQGVRLMALDVPYMQPALTFDGTIGDERPLKLLYGVISPAREPVRLAKADVETILAFLAEAIYGDHFEHRIDLNQAYRRYLVEWRNRLTRSVPDVVSLS